MVEEDGDEIVDVGVLVAVPKMRAGRAMRVRAEASVFGESGRVSERCILANVDV